LPITPKGEANIRALGVDPETAQAQYAARLAAGKAPRPGAIRKPDGYLLRIAQDLAGVPPADNAAETAARERLKANDIDADMVLKAYRRQSGGRGFKALPEFVSNVIQQRYRNGGRA
jgi:hypothetical protein